MGKREMRLFLLNVLFLTVIALLLPGVESEASKPSFEQDLLEPPLKKRKVDVTATPLPSTTDQGLSAIDRDDVKHVVIGGLRSLPQGRPWWIVSPPQSLTINIDPTVAADFYGDGFSSHPSDAFPQLFALYGPGGPRHGQIRLIIFEHVGFEIPENTRQSDTFSTFLSLMPKGGTLTYTSYWIKEYTEVKGDTATYGIRKYWRLKDHLIPCAYEDEAFRYLHEQLKNLRDQITHLSRLLNEDTPDAPEKHIRDALWNDYVALFKQNRTFLNAHPTQSIDSLLDRLKEQSTYTLNPETDFAYVEPTSVLLTHDQFFKETLKLQSVQVSIQKVMPVTNAFKNPSNALYCFSVSGQVPSFN